MVKCYRVVFLSLNYFGRTRSRGKKGRRQRRCSVVRVSPSAVTPSGWAAVSGGRTPPFLSCTPGLSSPPRGDLVSRLLLCAQQLEHAVAPPTVRVTCAARITEPPSVGIIDWSAPSHLTNNVRMRTSRSGLSKSQTCHDLKSGGEKFS